MLSLSLDVSPILAYTSGLLASMGLLTGILLIHRHEELEVAEAHEAVRYFGYKNYVFFLIPSFSKHTLLEFDLGTSNFKGLLPLTPSLEYSHWLAS